MAEGLLKCAFDGALADSKVEINVKSCGITALLESPAVEIAVDLMLKRGIDITGHRAQQLDTNLTNWADLILVMEESHREVIHTQAPSSRGKVFRLGHFSDIDIPDPYRQTRAVFSEVLDLIDIGVSKWVDEISRTKAATNFHK